jgi:polyhydroxyalkanoate synthesis regulator phasin
MDMNELENIVKNVVYGGIGAAAALVESAGDLARTLVEKGQEAVHANQETVDDVKRRLKEFCDRLMCDGVMDVTKLSPEQRAELRRQLDLADEADAAAVTDDDVPVCDEPEAAEPTYTVPDDEE